MLTKYAAKFSKPIFFSYETPFLIRFEEFMLVVLRLRSISVSHSQRFRLLKKYECHYHDKRYEYLKRSHSTTWFLSAKICSFKVLGYIFFAHSSFVLSVKHLKQQEIKHQSEAVQTE